MGEKCVDDENRQKRMRWFVENRGLQVGHCKLPQLEKKKHANYEAPWWQTCSVCPLCAQWTDKTREYWEESVARQLIVISPLFGQRIISILHTHRRAKQHGTSTVPARSTLRLLPSKSTVPVQRTSLLYTKLPLAGEHQLQKKRLFSTANLYKCPVPRVCVCRRWSCKAAFTHYKECGHVRTQRDRASAAIMITMVMAVCFTSPTVRV